jgi:plastocyanin/mono/diheme cytochrome c family protein
MSKRAFAIFGVVAVIGIVLIPLWALRTRGDTGAAEMPIPSSDRTAQDLFRTNCGACHTLAAGGTDGVVGPNLDVLLATGPETGGSVDANCQRVLSAINNGIGGRMPAGILQGVNAGLVANFISRNVSYVNSASSPPASIPPDKVKCTTPSTGAAPSGGGKPSGGGPPSGGPLPSAGVSSTIKASADPTGQLAYQQTSLSAKAGNVTVDFTNQAPLQHDFCLQQGSKQLGCTSVIQGASASKTFNGLKAGSYTFYCSVDGHEAAGMKGTLTVK